MSEILRDYWANFSVGDRDDAIAGGYMRRIAMSLFVAGRMDEGDKVMEAGYREGLFGEREMQAFHGIGDEMWPDWRWFWDCRVCGKPVGQGGVCEDWHSG
jgi:hypothetical protein